MLGEGAAGGDGGYCAECEQRLVHGGLLFFGLFAQKTQLFCRCSA
jgi:hypothetical protein